MASSGKATTNSGTEVSRPAAGIGLNFLSAKEEDYDPHLHRNNPKATNNAETLAHMLRASLGTGVLAVPQSFSRAGLAMGAIGTIVCGLLMTHCLRILTRSMYAACKIKRVPILNYPNAIKTAIDHGPPALRPLGSTLAISVDVFLVTYQLGTCCVYIVFIADNIKKLVDPYRVISVEIHMLIILLPIVLLNLIPSLKLLAPFSVVANVITFIGLFIIIYYMISTKKSAETWDEPIDYWGSLATYPLFFGTILFALTSVPVVVTVEMNMKTPKDFGTPFGVLNISMTIVIILYTAMGIVGYLYCKSQCSDSITLDLPGGALATTVLIMMVLAIFISYALHCYVPVAVLWNGYLLPRLQKSGSTHFTAAEYGLRIVLCLLTFLLAIFVPRLGLFISLFGAFCLSALGLCFPPLMDYCVRYPDNYGPGRIIMFKNLFLFIFGLVGLLAGTYVALLNIVLSFL